MHKLILLIYLLLLPVIAFAGDPDCSGPDNYAASMAFVQLKNSGLTTNDKIDWSKTKVTELAHQKIGKDLYKQVNLVIYTEKTGKKFAIIAINNASSEECSMTGPDLYLVTTYWLDDVNQKAQSFTH